MIGRIFTVGGFTLLSRITGFVRDIVLAAILGAGPVADAFFVALRLPNHFRAIFAEGAFNAAFVPSYARIREQNGAQRAVLLADAGIRRHEDRKSTRLNSSHMSISYAVFCLKKKNKSNTLR